MDVLSVSACVQAVTSAFRDAAGLVRRIREKQDCDDEVEYSNQQINDLEISLELGPPIVEGQYDSDLRKFGETYARGDSIAREQLKDVLITLQMAVLSNLTGVWMGIKSLDHNALQIASDDSRVNAVLCLMQWQQRLSSATAAQQQSSAPCPLGAKSRPITPPLTNVSSHSDRSSYGTGRPSSSDETGDQMASLSFVEGPPEASASPVSPGLVVPQNTHAPRRAGGRGDIELPSPLFARPRPSLSGQESRRSPSFTQALPVRSPYRPSIATTEETFQPRPVADSFNQPFPSPVSAFGSENEHYDSNDFGQSGLPRSLESPPINYAALYSPATYTTRRAPSLGTIYSPTPTTSSDHSTLEPVSSHSIHPTYRNDGRNSQAHASSFASAAPRVNSQYSPPAPSPNQQPIPSQKRTPSMSAPIPLLSQHSHFTASSITLASHPSLPLDLPSESNSYHGFCKGAYKLQIGLPAKKAFAIADRPAGLYSTFQGWRCSKCAFEGPISLATAPPGSGKRAAKPEKIFDHRIRMSEGGIRYRWAFLAKCHVMTKASVDGVKDGSVGTFGCLFCCAEGVARGWVEENTRTSVGGGAAVGVGAGVGSWGRRKSSVTSRVTTTSTTSSTTTNTTATPMFGNVESFMQHLEMHRTPEGMPGVEMQGRMKCVVGRLAETGEDFDINLPPAGGVGEHA